ncbi:MAG: phosphoribosylformylglycinamidine cyclo-ligase [Anaerolineales bacterium]|nr:phosphoribosylformylglycinamidine cyclo-ligase [Anaerolineales bacterium]
MTKENVGLVKTPLDELTYKVNGLAMQVMRELRSGHKERFYQQRLAELCRQAGLQAETEKRVEVWINDALVGYLYLDLWIENSLVAECKALSHDLTNRELHQMLVYLAATGSPVGMLYNFGKSTLEFKRVLRPAAVQDWQKYLYRVIWTPPDTTLPREDSITVKTPVRFSVISAFANHPSVLPSASEESVPLRDSATESADESVSIRDSVTKSADESADESAYNNAGVSIAEGARAVELMKESVRATYNESVLGGIGSFGGLFDAAALKEMDSPVLVASTDGVGTKVKLAAAFGRYRDVGRDIVNHCINDILVQGARPLFFMDYFATSKLRPEQTADVVRGIAEACHEAGVALLGGETAEMPGVYQPNEFDVAGTIVGVVERSRLLPRSNLIAGDLILGLPSSGPHTNGYSLIRKIFANADLESVRPELGASLADALLAPHRSYFNALYPHLDKVKALAHITGGGFVENIPRILPPNLNALIDKNSWQIPPLWKIIQAQGAIPADEMYRVFNMGIGMIAVVEKTVSAELQSSIPEPTFVIGELVKGNQTVVLQ